MIRWLPLLCIGLLLASGCAGTRGRADQELFPQLDGWKRARRIAVYTALDLSEYTAAAGFYRSYGFQDLQVKRYRRRGGYSVVAEVYRQATDDLAFGIYSQERPAHGPFLDLGGQGYAKRGGVYFFSGPYYVKIHSAELPSGSPVLTALASAMAERLGPAGGLPELFAVFPEQAKIRYSEMLVSEQFMGYDFFDEVYATDYSRGEFTYRMFIKPCATGSAASAVVQAYLNEIGDRRKLSGKSMFVLRDPFHGEVQMQIFGRYLVGVSGIEGQSLQEEFRRMGEQLVKTDF